MLAVDYDLVSSLGISVASDVGKIAAGKMLAHTSAARRADVVIVADDSFLTALKQAVAECNGVSISTWGVSENNRLATKMDEFEAVIKSARAQGIPVFVAAGDTASED